MKTVSILTIFLFIALGIQTASGADIRDLRQFSSRHGLSNSAILSVCQDSDGRVWIGTCDGLNVFDGTTLKLYKPTDVRNSLSGNLIENIMEAEEHILWIQTNYGLDRLDTHRQTIQHFKEFKDISRMAKTPENDVLVIKDDGNIYAYDRTKGQFHSLEVGQLPFERIQYMCVDRSRMLWVFTSDGIAHRYTFDHTSGPIRLTPLPPIQLEKQLLGTAGEGDLIYYINNDHALYEYDLHSGQKYYIADLAGTFDPHKQIAALLKQQDDYYIGFKSGGLLCLKYLPDQKLKYEVRSIGIESGIFCLLKGRYQDIVWIGTDGQGLYMYFSDPYSIRSTLLDSSVYQIHSPVRALFLDSEQTLWVGTKGDGILRLLHYSPDSTQTFNVDRLQTHNSLLTDNSVYCFARSRWNRLWIGTERGMNYYSYKEKKVRSFPVKANGKDVRYVHSICELNDSTLWVSTVGEGIVKIKLKITGGEPTVVAAHRIETDGGRLASNYFFTSYRENDSVLWFGNRGKGVFRMETQTEKMTSYRFDRETSNQTVNDIFAILTNPAGCWLGTSFGLIRMKSADDYRIYNEADGFPNNTIHGILEDRGHNLWLSTNHGVVCFNDKANTVSYSRQANLEVTEFSDGAAFNDEQTGTLFFGGTNGFVTIRMNNYAQTRYSPPLQFEGLTIFGKEYNLYDYLKEENNEPVLELDYHHNFFNLSFVAVDCIEGRNYTYSYQIEGLSDHWVENGFSTTAVFSHLPPGEYRLQVKWRNNTTGQESVPQSLWIHITPPWYMSLYAYLLYALIAVAIAAGCVRTAIHRYRRKRDAIIEKLNRQKRDEVYESKLRFFTNITHEFCTPLTLISGPCEKILSYAGTDGYIRKYTEMIRQNAKRLNNLISELIEFRRLETGHKELHVQAVAIDEQTRSIAETFGEWAESRSINFQLEIEPHIGWNTDLSCWNKIVNNLLSNAFKYTPEHGTIIVHLSVEKEQICLRISNSGKGIAAQDLPKVFDRYKVLDHFETQNGNGWVQRNGLGLAICHSMVMLLGGTIDVTSIPDGMTTFTVCLPLLPSPEKNLPAPAATLVATPSQEAAMPLAPQQPAVPYDASRPTLFIIDDDASMLWFVTEIFTGKYNVLPFDSARKALEALKQQRPDLILSDVMMPDMDGRTFTRIVKEDKNLTHIPLILLSALHHTDEQVKGIESGAEAYVTKPFSVEYLEKLVERLLRREEELKSYYASAYSAFKLEDGRLLHQEDQAFFERMLQTIDEHIRDAELSVEQLAAWMGMSTRQFYRKLKEVTDRTPSDIIREYRLTTAERLLLTTQLSVEEVMERAGFMNRGTFYKLFSAKFGMPPKQYRNTKLAEMNGGQQGGQ